MHPLYLLPLLSVALALPEFPARIPNGNAASRLDSGITCAHLGHIPCEAGAPRNAFGLDFMAAGTEFTRDLCMKDSDGDGLTNGEELGDPCCEWTVDNPTPLRETMLSHPGDASETGASAAQRCVTPAPTTTLPATSVVMVTPAAEEEEEEEDAPMSTEETSESPEDTMLPDTTPVAAEPVADLPDTATVPTATPVFPVTAPEAAATPTPGNTDDDDECFPQHATVRLEDGRRVSMDQLSIGDRVLVAPQQYSDVFMFTHKISRVTRQFVVIKFGHSNHVLTLTRGHYLYVNGELQMAQSVVAGDQLQLSDGSVAVVSDVNTAFYRGLYNPQTIHGDIIVDSVRVSTYTSAMDCDTAHSLLAPLRAMYSLFGWSMSAFDKGAGRFGALLR